MTFAASGTPSSSSLRATNKRTSVSCSASGANRAPNPSCASAGSTEPATSPRHPPAAPWYVVRVPALRPGPSRRDRAPDAPPNPTPPRAPRAPARPVVDAKPCVSNPPRAPARARRCASAPSCAALARRARRRTPAELDSQTVARLLRAPRRPPAGSAPRPGVFARASYPGAPGRAPFVAPRVAIDRPGPQRTNVTTSCAPAAVKGRRALAIRVRARDQRPRHHQPSVHPSPALLGDCNAPVRAPAGRKGHVFDRARLSPASPSFPVSAYAAGQSSHGESVHRVLTPSPRTLPARAAPSPSPHPALAYARALARTRGVCVCVCVRLARPRASLPSPRRTPARKPRRRPLLLFLRPQNWPVLSHAACAEERAVPVHRRGQQHD